MAQADKSHGRRIDFRLGFRRLLAVLIAVYWIVSVLLTVSAYRTSAAYETCLALNAQSERDLAAEKINPHMGLSDNDILPPQCIAVAIPPLKAAGEALGVSAAIFAGLATIAWVLRWIARGFFPDPSGAK
jgi:hypothetical protein